MQLPHLKHNQSEVGKNALQVLIGGSKSVKVAPRGLEKTRGSTSDSSLEPPAPRLYIIALYNYVYKEACV